MQISCRFGKLTFEPKRVGAALSHPREQNRIRRETTSRNGSGAVLVVGPRWQSQRGGGCEVLAPLEHAVAVQVGLVADHHGAALLRAV